MSTKNSQTQTPTADCPLPWSIGGRGNLIEDANGAYVINWQFLSDEDAKFIVTACNTHAQLVEVLESGLEMLNLERGEIDEDDREFPLRIRKLDDMILKLKAALTAAKSGK